MKPPKLTVNKERIFCNLCCDNPKRPNDDGNGLTYSRIQTTCPLSDLINATPKRGWMSEVRAPIEQAGIATTEIFPTLGGGSTLWAQCPVAQNEPIGVIKITQSAPKVGPKDH